jgi:hypothetical protein
MRDLDFWRKFHGPWYGFEHVEVARNHADESHAGQHYAIWMEENGLTNWRDYFWKWPENEPKRKHKWDLPEKYHYSCWTAERSIAYMEKCKSEDKPFFLWSSFQDPHPPYLVPEPWASMYDPDDMVLGKVATGTYCFDRAPGWNPQARYAVRAVDGDGNASPWRIAERLSDEPLEAACLGGHFPEAGREGWRAETTADGRRYAAMTWVPPVKDPAGDLGGNANQIGGAEGYWEGPGKARAGRGWQQAASDFACVRTWVASQPGTVRILGRAMKEYYRRNEGGPLRVRILHGDAQVWPERDWAVVPAGDLAGASHDVTLAVARGDTVRFVLDKAAKPESAVLAWMPRIVYAAGETAARSGASVVRILCGAARPYTDRCGNVWSADAFYRGGAPVGTTAAIGGATPTAADRALYQAGRVGSEFSYEIPVTPGLYSVRLKLAEPKLDYFFERPMNLDINGRRVLSNFDVCHAARGPRRAYERVFRYLVPDAAGKLVLRFTTGWDPLKTCDDAIVQAIEVLPEQKSAVRIDAGAARPWIDWNGFPWSADGCFQGGRPLESAVAVAQAAPTLYDQQLYRTARAGKEFQYKVPATPGLYTVHLKFAELWLQEAGKVPVPAADPVRTARGW